MPKNRGFLGTGRKPRDWQFGSLSGADLPTINPKGDHTEFLPKGEWQNVNGVDVLGCVSYSFNNCLEIHAKQSGLGEYDFDDRTLMVVSGTGHQGNNFYTVWTAARKLGLAAQGVWPITPEDDTWDEIYGTPPLEAELQMQKFRDSFDIGLQWVEPNPDDMNEALKQTPLWCANGGHAFTVIADQGSKWKVYDSYPTPDSDYIGEMPYDKIVAAAQVWLIPKEIKPLVEIDNDSLVFENGQGRFGLKVGDKMYVDELDKILATWTMRSPSFDRKRTVTAEQFDSFKKYNLKNQSV